MKYQRFFILLAGTCFCLAVCAARAQTQTITIMPMGDSVTSRGSTPESSYRYWLYVDLTNAGFTNFQFVGQNSGVSDGTPANSWPQESYEGGPLSGIPDGDGWSSADGVLDAPNAASLVPNIVLLDLGANDQFQNIPLGQTETNLETIIQDFAAQNSSVVILLATPTGFVPATNQPVQQQRQQKVEQSHLAGSMGKVASAERRAHVDIVTVNLFGGFNPNRDTKDGTHPNVQGEQLIARRYFSALRPILRKMEKDGL